MADLGPVEVMVVAFPGSQFNGTVAPALQDVVARGDVTIIDMAFIAKQEDGSVVVVELPEVEDAAVAAFGAAAGELIGLLNEEDLLILAEALEPGSSAAAIVFEHTWARALSAAVGGSNGQVIFSERIPREAVEAAQAAVSV